MLKSFSYKFDKGPLDLDTLKEEEFLEGNCRLAVQYFLFKNHNLFLEPESILNPKGYNETGSFVVKEGEFKINSFEHLKEGDIIYAERLANKKTYLNRDDWIIGLHSAIYLGNSKFYHANIIDKKSNIWDMKKFLKHYKLIAAKRVLV